MKSIPFAACLLLCWTPLRAQPASFSLSASQSSVSDWKEGTRSSLVISSSLHVQIARKWEDVAFSATVRAALGATRQRLGNATAAVLLPTENELFSEATVSRPMHWRIDPFVSASVRTQITESFRLVGTKFVRTAALRDPITTMQSAGCTWEHRHATGTGTLRAGLALKQIRALHHVTQTDNPRTRGVQERWRSEAGIEFVYDAAFKLDSLLFWRGRITTFTAAHQLEDSIILVENEFRYRIWTLFGCVLTFRVQYDPARSRTVQFQQNISVGLVL